MVSVQYRIGGRTASAVVADVERLVREGVLPTGAALPTVRGLAAELGVAPGTVAAAYRTLRDRGVVEADGRRGTRVRGRPALAVRSPGPAVLPPGVRDLSSGHPDPDLLPSLGRALARLATARGEGRALVPAEPVLPALAGLARQRLAADGVPAGAVTVASGTLDALERVLGAHLRPGDRVAVEDPGWPNGLDLLTTLGLTPVPVAVDAEGPHPQALAAALTAGARAAVLTSRAQNPTGAAVSPRRADELRAVLDEQPDVLLVEDDHAAELAEVPLAPLAGATRSWAFVRSVSKPYGPDLRLAVLAADEETASRVQGRLRLGAGWVSTLLQEVVVDLWRDPEAEAAVRRAAERYAARRQALVDLLTAAGLHATGRTGINVWVPVPDEAGVAARLLARGWAVAPGARFRLRSAPAIRVTVTGLDQDGVRELAQAVVEAVRPPATAPTY